MPDYMLDRRDLDFVLFDQFDLMALTRLERYEGLGRDDVVAVLDGAQRMAAEVLAPARVAGDREGCRLADGKVRVPECFHAAFARYAEGGWVGVSRSPELGGMGLPLPLGIATMEMFIGANSSLLFYPGLSVSAGHLLEVFAAPELRDLVVPKLYAGTWAGTMCLTEAQAGTAVGDLRSTAEPMPGTDMYKIRGNKIFISAGDHDLTENIVHLVLARIPGDPAGTKGISLFLVPKVRFDASGTLQGDNDVTTVGLEHKTGINGSATAALSFGERGACTGYLVGERCKGIVAMFQMMNEARVSCGVQGAALANLSYQWSLAYAKERIQGTRAADPDGGKVAIVAHPDVRRNLLLAKAYAEGSRALLLRAAFLAEYAKNAPDEETRGRCGDLLDLLTPVCKAYATDRGFDVTVLGVQIHGGYGYIKEYGVEQNMRDVKIASIYEGTNGVQAIDLLSRKMRLKKGALFAAYLDDFATWVRKHRSAGVLGAELSQIEAAGKVLQDVAAALAGSAAASGHGDPEVALLRATPFLELFGHVEVARLLVDQAFVAESKLADLGATGDAGQGRLVADNPAARYFDGKTKTARFFLATVLPHIHALASEIKGVDRSALDIAF